MYSVNYKGPKNKSRRYEVYTMYQSNFTLYFVQKIDF